MKCCQMIKKTLSKRELMKNYTVIKEYDPQPKNEDGSTRWFLYRWDDGKSGVRRLIKCKKCGCFFLIQDYHLHKFSKNANVQYEDWYPIEGEIEADYANTKYTGLQWELRHKPCIRCEDDKVVYL